MAGHSKWHSIRHKKAANDAKRGKVLTKHAKILAVIGRNDPSPETNPSLRVAIANAKADGVPKDNIERILKKLSGEGQDAARYSEQLYEGYGPEGIPFLVSALTDNVNRTFPQVRSAFEKNGGKLASPNAVKFLFDHVGIILVETNGKSENEMFELVAECGAEDFHYDENETEITTSFEDLGKVRDALSKKMNVIKTEPVYRAKDPQVITDEKILEKLETFISVVEETCDDVDEVYGGFLFQGEILSP